MVRAARACWSLTSVAVLALLRQNAEINKLPPERCSVAALEWGEPAGADILKHAPYDVVMASDVV
jgi:hypothetical protein